MGRRRRQGRDREGRGGEEGERRERERRKKGGKRRIGWDGGPSRRKDFTTFRSVYPVVKVGRNVAERRSAAHNF